MIHAYDKVYLEKARTALGRMLDFAVYDLKYEIGDFWGLFLASGIAKRFGEGDFQLLVGMSGVELAYKVLECSGIENERIKPMYAENRSEEYWADNTISPVVPNVSGGRNVSTGQKAVNFYQKGIMLYRNNGESDKADAAHKRLHPFI